LDIFLSSRAARRPAATRPKFGHDVRPPRSCKSGATYGDRRCPVFVTLPLAMPRRLVDLFFAGLCGLAAPRQHARSVLKSRSPVVVAPAAEPVREETRADRTRPPPNRPRTRIRPPTPLSVRVEPRHPPPELFRPGPSRVSIAGPPVQKVGPRKRNGFHGGLPDHFQLIPNDNP